MRVALYLRVSTNNKGQNPENQLKQLREYYQSRGWTLTREYVDYDSASKKRDGQEFITMLEDGRKKRFDCLLFWSMDRFSREGVYKTLSYLHQLAGYGVDFFSYTEQYLNSVGVFREAIIGILAAIAQQESIRISERTRAGMDRARVGGTRSGKAIGRPQSTQDAEVVQLRQAGASWPAISRKLGIGIATAARAYLRSTPAPVPDLTETLPENPAASMPVFSTPAP